ncbi:hypothetical protein Cgig2_020700 [Carnegiea gigantea]|uniref:DUF4283 domain-containing protein n=1 Tax=Carnegiea gigantea TaxID=171969 RepID=A0A9Q1GP11_9CARY|nr:hypothetical protein Cgig2_020700 [Carnegiea gigantea]
MDCPGAGGAGGEGKFFTKKFQSEGLLYINNFLNAVKNRQVLDFFPAMPICNNSSPNSQQIHDFEFHKDINACAASCQDLAITARAAKPSIEDGSIIQGNTWNGLQPRGSVEPVVSSNAKTDSHDEKWVYSGEIDSVEVPKPVVQHGFYHFTKKPFIVKPWTADFEKDKIQDMHVWVQFPKLDLKLEYSALTKLASLLDTPIMADKNTKQKNQVDRNWQCGPKPFQPLQVVREDANQEKVRTEVPWKHKTSSQAQPENAVLHTNTFSPLEPHTEDFQHGDARTMHYDENLVMRNVGDAIIAPSG